jgi:endonuclease YncB( thermonuclease family)
VHWNRLILLAAVLVASAAIYVVLRWRGARVVYRAIAAVGAICFVAGLLAGVWAFHLASARSVPTPARSVAIAQPAPSDAKPLSVPNSERPAIPAAPGDRVFTAKVAKITDGDTIKVLDPNGAEYVIRLAGIDAPEHNQEFGTESTRNLATLLSSQTVTLDCGKEESYGRLVCKVLVADDDICLDQVKAGLAWHYKQFENEQSPQDRASYAAAEDTARAAHAGLWADAHPVAPWDFRHGKETKLCFDRADHRVECSASYQGPVRGNRRRLIYEWPGCPYYDQIGAKNRVEFPDVAAAVAAGFRPARNCD